MHNNRETLTNLLAEVGAAPEEPRLGVAEACTSTWIPSSGESHRSSGKSRGLVRVFARAHPGSRVGSSG
jgi:hypothetical protein